MKPKPLQQENVLFAHTKEVWWANTHRHPELISDDNFVFLGDVLSAVKGLKQDFQSFALDGTVRIAQTEYLKGQKNGELMMLNKTRHLIDKWFPVAKRGGC